MDPLSLIVGALAAGAAAGLTDTAAGAVKDAYAGLQLAQVRSGSARESRKRFARSAKAAHYRGMDVCGDEADRYRRLVAEMAIPHRRTGAYWQLLSFGPAVVPALHEGLSEPDAAVREGCIQLLDHFLTEDTIPAVIAALDDEHPRVRMAAAHALACDRCKKDVCRPTDGDVLPAAIRLLTTDPDKHVRAMAAELVGKAVHTAPEAVMALEAARDGDTEPAVRKKAGWYAPGGTIYARTAR